MINQLVLIDTPPSWRLDSCTRELGIRGVARARRALREARSRAAEADLEIDSESDCHSTARLASAA